jgi:hypothetical protein
MEIDFNYKRKIKKNLKNKKHHVIARERSERSKPNS